MGHLSKMVEISLWIILSVGPFGMLKVNSVGNYGRKIFLNKEPFFPKVFFAISWQNDANHPLGGTNLPDASSLSKRADAINL